MTSFDRLREVVDDVHGEVLAVRRDLHRHPELAFHEQRTADILARRCAELGFDVRTDVGGGLIADLAGAADGPTLMLRADMDALPIEERDDGRSVRSSRPGVMHACGHDAHVAMALGAGRALSQIRTEWKGRVRLCFQPAEEVAGGAMPMIAAGCLDGVDRVLGLHVWAPLQTGHVMVGPTPLFGSADEVVVTIRGRGGHGGLPHTAVDPVVVAAEVILAIQTIVSRETSPFDPSVITVGRIEGGTAFNVIANDVQMRATVRAMSAAERARLIARVEEVSTAIARAGRATADVARGRGTPPVVSDPAVAEVVRRAAVDTVGADRVHPVQPITVGDDVAYFLERVPGCYFLLGARDQGEAPAPPHHSPDFDIDEACLPIGVEILTRAALSLLQ